MRTLCVINKNNNLKVESSKNEKSKYDWDHMLGVQ